MEASQPPPTATWATLAPASGQGPSRDLSVLAEAWLGKVCECLGLRAEDTHPGERAAFVAYALAFPQAFQGLLDSYSVMRSGLPNFLAVALALAELGYRASGVRLDSGDLLQQAREIRSIFRKCASRFQVPWLEAVSIAVSNNIDDRVLAQLAHKDSEVDLIGIGTNVVTCPLQPSLGCVYKLVSVRGQPRRKLTEDSEKQTLPGSKAAYRLYDREGAPILDLLQLEEESPPQAGQELRVWPLDVSGGDRRSQTLTPVSLEPLLRVYFHLGQTCEPIPSLAESRALAQKSLSCLSSAQKRPENPEPYQVALSEKLHALLENLAQSSQEGP